MSEMMITLVRVRCDEVTDDFLEGLNDEFGWRLTVYDLNGKSTMTEEVPMVGMEAGKAGTEYMLDRELGRIGPEGYEAWLEFWEQDTFSEDDLLGRLEIRRDGTGGLTVSPSLSTTEHGDGCYRLTGHHGDYTVWLKFETH